MSPVTDNQIRQARQWDLLSYLQTCEPQELRPSGPHEYRTATHGSLVISNGKWNWVRGGVGGTTALDYLIKVRGMAFVDAVNTLARNEAPPHARALPETPPPPKKFELPECNRYPSAVTAYLQGRGIDPEILRRCFREGILYESRKHRNCVFVGRDPAKVARFACLRGTLGDFKLDVAGSSKRYGFFLPSSDPASQFVAVCESPIDALSLATLRRMEDSEWDKSHYLSLGGTSPLAALQFLKDHPGVDYVTLHLDNDQAGLEGMCRLKAALEKDDALKGRHLVIAAEPPPKKYGKDYNEMLMAKLSRPAPQHGEIER